MRNPPPTFVNVFFSNIFCKNSVEIEAHAILEYLDVKLQLIQQKAYKDKREALVYEQIYGESMKNKYLNNVDVTDKIKWKLESLDLLIL